VSAVGVAEHYSDLLDGWVMDHADAAAAADLTGGPAVAITDTMMDDPDVAAALAATCLDLAAAIREADA
jgi:LPPG:FO 2-phospho-L-lactate transferase